VVGDGATSREIPGRAAQPEPAVTARDRFPRLRLGRTPSFARTGPERIRSDRIDPIDLARPVGLPLPVRPVERGPIGMDALSDAEWDERAADAVGWPDRTAVAGGPMARPAPWPGPDGGLSKPAATLIVAGSWGYLARSRGATSRRVGRPGPRKAGADLSPPS
jgi:hypothetical protein